MLLVATGIFIRNYPDITEIQAIASVIAIALGGIPLLVMIIMWISKSLQGNNNTIIKNLKNSWIIFIITILLIAIPILLVKLPIDETIIDALITTFASVTGGSLTLIGVIWTIRSNRESLKEEEYLKYKPWFTGYTDECLNVEDMMEDQINLKEYIDPFTLDGDYLLFSHSVVNRNKKYDTLDEIKKVKREICFTFYMAEYL